MSIVQQQQLLIIFLGWTLLVYGVYFLYTGYYKKKYVKVTAVVTDMDSYWSRSGRPGRKIEVFNPEFTYQWNGWDRKVRPVYYASRSNYQLGDEVVLYVDPKNGSNIWNPDITKWIFRGIWGVGAFAILVRLK